MDGSVMSAATAMQRSWSLVHLSGEAECLSQIYSFVTRVSFETSFDSNQPKLEPKLVSALSETKKNVCFGCFASLAK
jgi:hypothetical protein